MLFRNFYDLYKLYNLRLFPTYPFLSKTISVSIDDIKIDIGDNAQKGAMIMHDYNTIIGVIGLRNDKVSIPVIRKR